MSSTSSRTGDRFAGTHPGSSPGPTPTRNREHYEHLMRSGLDESLRSEELILPHRAVDPAPEEVPDRDAGPEGRSIAAEGIPFLSHPHEWCFSQLRDAALATLRIQELALDHGMTLQRASAFQIQFVEGRPLLVDPLSLRCTSPGTPWVAYREFCQHFFGPLQLAAQRDIGLDELFRGHLEGIPLDQVSRMLPWSSYFRPAALLHLHLHARAARRHRGGLPLRSARTEAGQKGMLASLRSGIERLRWDHPGGEDVDEGVGFDGASREFEQKLRLVSSWLDSIDGAVAWDLGAGSGLFSRVSAALGMHTISLDRDPAVVERTYVESRARGESRILPLVIDLCDRGGGLGAASRELARRGPADVVLALSLVQHLALEHRIPFEAIAEFLQGVTDWLVIEFVPREDPVARRCLETASNRPDEYDLSRFEAVFSRAFEIHRQASIGRTNRNLYLMRRRLD